MIHRKCPPWRGIRNKPHKPQAHADGRVWDPATCLCWKAHSCAGSGFALGDVGAELDALEGDSLDGGIGAVVRLTQISAQPDDAEDAAAGRHDLSVIGPLRTGVEDKLADMMKLIQALIKKAMQDLDLLQPVQVRVQDGVQVAAIAAD